MNARAGSVAAAFDLLYAAPLRDRRASYRVFEFYLTAYLPARWNALTKIRFCSASVFTGDLDNSVRSQQYENGRSRWVDYFNPTGDVVPYNFSFPSRS